MDQSKEIIKNNYVVFDVGGYKFGINIMPVSEIRDGDEPVKDIGGPDNLIGLIELEGEQVPIYSLVKKFGLSAESHENQSRIIVKHYNSHLGFEVDQVLGVEEIKPEEFMPVPKSLQFPTNRYLTNISERNNEIILIVESSELISDRELDEILKTIENQKVNY